MLRQMMTCLQIQTHSHQPSHSKAMTNDLPANMRIYPDQNQTVCTSQGKLALPSTIGLQRGKLSAHMSAPFGHQHLVHKQACATAFTVYCTAQELLLTSKAQQRLGLAQRRGCGVPDHDPMCCRQPTACVAA